MIFGVIMPAFVGLSKLDGPYDDWRAGYGIAALNNWSFWILPFAFTLLIISYLCQVRRP